ncbi:MAG: penicillin-binding protein 1C [Tannerella sp.]|jgi:penicillin-binding protein 1C|nr:penicillin-binding protein 1C [Tannerella sp.]
MRGQKDLARGFVLLVLAALVLAYVFCLPKPLFHAPCSTVVTDRNGALLGARIAADGQWRFPPRHTVPRKVERCLLAFEDRQFYRHWGVNPFALCRAFWQNLRAGRVVSGGSTLSMQVIRLARNKPRTIREKLIEILLATRLEFRASKKEILAMYVSHAPFGGNVVGLDAAAWRYFGHSADELSWAEAALLAVLPNAPSLMHPAKGRAALLDKRNRLLARLYKDKAFDASTYRLALTEPLPAKPQALPQIAPYLVDRFYRERPGLYSRSTIDRGIQQQVEALAERWGNMFERSDIRNLGILVVDLPSDQVIAYCGNVHHERKEEGYQVDVIRAPRSTGSILKPFLYYALLQEGSLLPGMLLPDVPVNINGFAPQNFDRHFDGAVPAAEALARSLNVPAVHLLQRYGVPKFRDLLRQIGLHTINRPASDYGLSLILGGAEANLWDVTNAYAQMGRSLLHLPQRPVSLLRADTAKAAAYAFRPGAVWQTFDALKELNRPEEIDWRSISSMQTVAWKTGTSYGFRDAWAVGVTPRYAIGVWVGNASGEGRPGLVGAETAGPVLFDLFNLLPSSSWFERPPGAFVEAEVCRQSGYLKGRFCTDVDTVLILPAGLKTEACPFHHLVTLTADGKYRLYAHCARGRASVQKAWFVLPPVWEWYYKQQHPEYRPLPPFLPGCGEDDIKPMQFIYPPMNAHIRLPKQLNGSRAALTVELAHTNPDATVFWHLDNHYLTQTRDFHKITLHPAPGEHHLTAVDEDGNVVSTTFFIQL